MSLALRAFTSWKRNKFGFVGENSEAPAGVATGAACRARFRNSSSGVGGTSFFFLSDPSTKAAVERSELRTIQVMTRFMATSEWLQVFANRLFARLSSRFRKDAGPLSFRQVG